MVINAIMVMGFLLSPRAFMLTGSGIGLAGHWYLLVIAFLLTTHFATVQTDKVNTNHSLESLGYGIRFFTLVFFSCSILGIAGYAFNEVFLYWFPNFLFSFMVLGCSLMTSLASQRTAKRIQLAATLVILLGIIVLSTSALWTPTPKGADSPDFLAPYALAPFSEALLFMAPILIGYELYGLYGKENQPPLTSIIALGMTVLFLSIFAYAALSVSGTERLADSTVPHMIGARRILGQTGRYIMGAVVILGSYVAFNTILTVLKSPLVTLMDSNTSPRHPGRDLGRKAAATAFPALIVSTLLLLGYAGEPITESYIAGGFALWFAYYGTTTIMTLRSTHSPLIKVFKVFGLSSCFFLAYGILQQPEYPLKGITVAIGVSLAITALDIMGRKRFLP